MAWNAPATAIAGSVLTAAWLNTYVRDNLLALRAGALSLSSQSANDFLYASAADQLGRMAAVAGKAPRFKDDGSGWEMSEPLNPIANEVFG